MLGEREPIVVLLEAAEPEGDAPKIGATSEVLIKYSYPLDGRPVAEIPQPIEAVKSVTPVKKGANETFAGAG